MCAKQNMALIRYLASHPLLTEAEARRELGLPPVPVDLEDRAPEPSDHSGNVPVSTIHTTR